ncbi:hypothetical protein B0A50_00221 [Salinomyces thailandicus]|uniref:Uncharacterized protein n=1 Tax=Salinomyces thailandicus TaxID=706561 RepID=A0A4U0UFA7_9PEZI|nr:hypothetical protein B0A50_00221 [Salinomyces thailandica]
MRLLNTRDLSFKDINGTEIAKYAYAILSHRWLLPEAGLELTYKDVLRRNFKGPGYHKIWNACHFALSRGFQWIWIDTCCIDKTSSAELTESINSMWTWYQQAEECYAHLADVPSWLHRNGRGVWMEQRAPKRAGRLTAQSQKALSRSDWFRRGWTLQELLAPQLLIFLNSDWKILATKHEMTDSVSAITRIPAYYLRRSHAVSKASVAMRMSWVARRVTARTEDMAYCMLGILDVNMPLLYGEGRKAFMRLQLEIIKKSDDESIFAWTTPSKSSGMLADWPTAFAASGDIMNFKVGYEHRLPYSMTNRGLELRLPNWSFFKEKSRKGARVPARDPSYRPINVKTKLFDDGGCDYDVPEIPDGDPCLRRIKKFQLACGSCDRIDRDLSTTSDIIVAARQRVVIITLCRMGLSWQRVNCNNLEFFPKFVDLSESDWQTLFYVPQKGI